jgi:4-amino-4-deoxy-L-arabinose transferase-like glycosyltransferase
MRTRFVLALGLAIAFTTIFLRLGGLALMDPDEGRNATVASEMEDSGSWLVPTYNGLDYLDKPAFFFKAVALAFEAFGRSETAARLPSALFAAATLAITYAFCRREFGTRCAALALLVVATTPLFLAFARIVIFDMTLCFFVCGALFAGYSAEESEGAARKRWYLAGAAAAGLATAVKGPVGFIVPALVLTVLAFVERRPRAILRLLAPANLAVFFAIALTWFLGLVRERPDFAYYGLVLETFKRFTSPIFHRTQPFYYYGPVILGAFLSWSLLYPEAIAAAWRARRSLSRPERFLAIWAVVVVVFFSISQSKLPGYVLSATVALGVLAARLFDRAEKDGSVRARAIVLRGALVLGGVCLLLGAALGAEIAMPGLLQRVFPRARLAAWSPVVVPGCVALLAVAALAFYSRAAKKIGATFSAFVAMPLGVLVSGYGGFVNYADAHSSRALSRGIEAAATGAEVACVTTFPQGLTLYLGRRATLFSDTGEEMSSNYVLYELSEHPDWPPQVVKLSERDRWIDARKNALVLVAHQDDRELLESISAAHGGRAIELPAPWRGALIAPQGAR